jgi:hypothetical protein
MTLMTVYALFFDDIRIIAFPSHSDNIFFTITFVGVICFTTEILLASYAKNDYRFSFFFWLDIVSSLSMIPDVGWFWSIIIGIEGGTGSKDALALAKTSKSGRVTRVIRVIRLIRLIRIVKLYKQSQIARQKAVQHKQKTANSNADLKKKKDPSSMLIPGKMASDNQIEPINPVNNLYGSERDSQEDQSLSSEE